MKDIADAAELLTTARELLTSELLPALPKDQRYAGLMIANALGIAAREQRWGDMASRGEASRLVQLLVDAACAHDEPAAAHSTAERSVWELRRALCGAIRRGVFDDEARQQMLMAHLMQAATDWVAVSNPKAVRSGDAAAR
jgi:hypothetical protein